MRRTSLLAMLLAAPIAIGPAPAFAEDLEEVRLGLLRVSSQAPFFIGVEKGYFEEAGIDAQIIFFDAAVPATTALASGDVDMSIIGFVPAFFNLAMDGGIKVVSGHAREMPGFQNTGIFASDQAWENGVRSLDDLEGRSIGLTTMGSTNHYIMDRIMADRGFDIGQSRLVPAQGLGNLAAMVQGNQVEVASGASTGFLPLLAEGTIHLLGWAGDEVPMQLSALATSDRMIEERSDTIRAVIEVYDRAAAEYFEGLVENRRDDGTFEDQARADELLAIIEEYTGTPADRIADALSYIDSRLEVSSIVEMAEWYAAEGHIGSAPEPSVYLDLSFVEGHENVPDTMAAAD